MRSKYLTVAVMACTALSPILSAPALALPTESPVPQYDGQELAGMQDQCDAIAASYDTLNGDIWTGEVVVNPGNALLVSGPTEVPGTRVIDLDTVEGHGDLIPSDTYIEGDPYRNGGSVNMFGDQWASSAYWTNSRYDYTADFDSTFAYSFDCNISQEVFHPEVIYPLQGYYEVFDDGTGGDEDAIRANCEAHTANTSAPWWGDPFSPGGRCQFVDTTPPPEPEYHDPAVLIATVAGDPILEDQFDNLNGHEENGGPFEVSGEVPIGKVVVCISPANPSGGKKGVPGEWRAQNGYDGGSFTGPEAGCNTIWFDTGAKDGVSNLNENGTFISVPPQV